MSGLGRWFRTRAGGTGAFSAGKAYLAREDYDTAAMAFEDAEVAFKKEFGPKHKWVEQAIAYRAWCYVKLGRPADGVTLYERALSLELELSGKGDRTDQLQEQLGWARSELERSRNDSDPAQQ
jgi:tetratricopeptide (TPR) repeat protein